MSRIKQIKQRINDFINSRPLTSFFGLLALIVILIIVSNQLQQPIAEQAQAEPVPASVEVFSVGSAPTYKTTATIENSRLITITAQSPAIVRSIPVNLGQEVYAGATLVNMASNYSGGNPASIQRQLAQRQLTFTQETYDKQKEIIRTQRDLASQTEINAEELRRIQAESEDTVEQQLSLTRGIISFIDDNLESLEENNINGSNDELINQTEQLKLQYLSTLNQVQSANRNLDYSTDEDNPPTKLTDLQKNLTDMQLDIQEQSLDLQKEVQELQLQLARINEANYFPAAPKEGTVERIHVSIGDTVNPGTPLITLNANQGTSIARASVPQSIAENIRHLDTATLTIAGKKHQLTPTYISQSQTDGKLYSAYFTVPEGINAIDGQVVPVELTIGLPDTLAANPTIPIDAVYQTPDQAYVFVIGPDNSAQSRTIQLGEVLGDTVIVTQGLKQDTQVIVSRTVVAGDPVTPSNN